MTVAPDAGAAQAWNSSAPTRTASLAAVSIAAVPPAGAGAFTPENESVTPAPFQAMMGGWLSRMSLSLGSSVSMRAA